MPTYEYQCEAPECNSVFEVRLSLNEYNAPQACPACGGDARKLISALNFVLKGDDWPGKNIKIKGQMADKNKRLQARQDARKRDAPGVTLAPNVNGERTESWADAQKLASEKGLSASTYDAKVREERK